MRKLLACVVCFGLAAMIATAGGAGKGDLKVEGVWTATAGISDGKKIPDDDVAKIMLVVTIKTGKYSVSVMGNEVEAGSYKVDGKQKPAHLDLTISKGKDEGKKQLGLLKVDGDVMTVAMAVAGAKDRPKNFEGGEGIEVTVMKRGK